MTAPFRVDAIAIPHDEERQALAAMLLIRRFEEKAGQLYALGAVPGVCELSIGREAGIIGLLRAARPDDPIVAGRRCHGLMLARGLAPDRIFGELLGRTTGYMGGLAGTRDIVSPAHHYLGGHAVPGAQAALATGAGLAARREGRGRVVLCVLDDGAHTTGLALKAMAEARRLALPVLFVIDENTGTETCESASLREIAATGLTSERVDGIDVRKVEAAARRVLGAIRDGSGPAALEIMTHAFRGHAAPHAGNAGLKREEADPILRARARMIEQGLETDAALKALEKNVRDAVMAAAAAAKAAPLPSPGASGGQVVK